MKQKVVHLSSVHTPFDIRIFVKECRTLVEMGFDVTFVVPHEKDERVEGVNIRAVPKASGRLKRMFYTVWAVFRISLREKGDLYHFHDSELIPIGLVLKLLGKKVIYDVHEDLPRQILSKHWIHLRLRKLVARIAEVLEYFSAQAFNGIITVTPEIASRFPKGKTVIVQNYPLKQELALPYSRTFEQDENIVVYIGGISLVRGVMEMTQCISILPESLNVKLVLAGDFSPNSLQSDLKKMQAWKKVEFLGWLSRNQIRELLETAKVGLVTLHPIPNYVTSQPIKLFEYMSAGLPVIASDFPKWREIITNHRCGLLVDPLKPQEIAEKIQYIIENPVEAQIMGNNGKKAVEKFYIWDVEAKKMLAMYQALLSGVKERKNDDGIFRKGEE